MRACPAPSSFPTHANEDMYKVCPACFRPSATGARNGSRAKPLKKLAGGRNVLVGRARARCPAANLLIASNVCTGPGVPSERAGLAPARSHGVHAWAQLRLRQHAATGAAPVPEN